MSKKLLYARLGAALVGAAFAFACTAALDTDELSREWKDRLDGPAAVDGSGDTGDLDSAPADTLVPLDTGGCVQGKACTVAGKKGRCAYGKSVCGESGMGYCSQVYSPVAETCNGTTAVYDWDCDGLLDQSDPSAHTSCGTGKYCAGASCKTGCWATSQCTGSTNICTNHVCRCGTAAACAQPNPVCSAGVCRCDADSTCKTGETCASGVCNCGASAGPAKGPFCPSGTCNPTTGSCSLPPTDAGPEVGPPDQGAPDKAVTPDQAVPDQAASADQ